MIRLSIVIPVYNEDQSVSHLYDSLKRALVHLPPQTEVILVDDGSSDNTFVLLKEIAKKDKAISVIKLRRNFGQTPAMSAGIDFAHGDVIVTLDADMQNDPADIPRLLKKMEEGYDIVSGWRKDRKDKAISRRLPSMIANWMIGAITGVKIHDYGCTLKAYRASLLKELP
ncbi:glycosyl transferase, group 2 family protein, partial [sediment metagenome]